MLYKAITQFNIYSVGGKFWRGEYGLGQSFWRFYVIGYILLLASVTFLLFLFERPLPLVIVARCLGFGYPLWTGVGVWRSASRMDNAQCRFDRAMPMLAKTMVLITSLGAICTGAKVLVWMATAIN